MPRYEIQSWDPVLLPNNTQPSLMLSIKPDKDFVDYTRKNNFTVLAEVQDSSTVYDGKKMVAVVNSSVDYPNYRPNYYNEKGFYTLTLSAEWRGYPPTKTLGSVLIRGMKGPDKLEPVPPRPYKVPVPVREMYSSASTGLQTKQIVLFLGSIGLVLIALLIIARCKKARK